jgi:cellulose synthase/poly-beta-1,6-N-acetylglucosamine synthase-like glycosyltransferase
VRRHGRRRAPGPCAGRVREEVALDLTRFEWTLLITYFSVVGALAVFGFHRYQMVYYYFKHKKRPWVPDGMYSEEGLPRVTIQLPTFNEMYVLERLIDAVCEIDYPLDKLEIQVLDDSTDETTEIGRRAVDRWRARGYDIELIHRTNRRGFKAGALEEGIKKATGEFVAVFDADFIPDPNFLRHTVHYFTNPKVGMVQTRWGHINRDHSLLTQVQAIMLDGHFQLEHTARNRSGRFFNFNGTAGVWRRETIEDAGGWEHDTLTEDIDLSYRAQLKGWQFLFLPDVVSPAELPDDMNAFKTQQHRWTKGQAQCGKKLLPRIWRSKTAPLKAKIEATFHLTLNLAYPLMVLLCILMLPMLTIDFTMSWLAYIVIDIPFFIAATTSVFSFYFYSQKEVYPKGWLARIPYIPFVVSTGVGMSLMNTKAMLSGYFGEAGEFVRTPKQGANFNGKRYSSLKSLVPILELAFAVYYVFALALSIYYGRYMAMPFIGLFLFGFAYTGFTSLKHGRRPTVENEEAVPVPVLSEVEEAVTG